MPTQSKAPELDLVRDLAWSDLYIFNKFVLGYDKFDEEVHRPLCQMLTRRVLLDAGENPPPLVSDWSGADTERNAEHPRITRIADRKYKLTELPRGSYKSTAHIGLALWLLWRNPQWSIMIASANEDLVARIMREIERHVTSNLNFKAICGDWYAGNKQWTTLSKTFGFKKSVTEASIFATSVTSSKTGLHPNVAILDDVFDDRASSSTPIAEQVRRFFDDLPFLLVDPDYRWIVGTRWGMFDIYHYIETDEGLKELYDVYIRAAHNPDGSLWAKRVITEEKIRSAKLELRHRPWHYSAQYDMRPLPRSEQTLDLTKIKEYPREEEPERGIMSVGVGIDPAGARGSGSSSWAVSSLGITAPMPQDTGAPAPNFYVLDVVKKKMSAKEAVDTVIDLVITRNADWIVVEATGMSHQFIDATLRPELQRRNITARIIEVKPHGESKERRIRDVENGLGMVISDGRFWMCNDQFELHQELNQFPSDASFDALDILAYMVRDANEHKRWPRTYSRKKQAEGEWENYDEYLSLQDDEKAFRKIEKEAARERRDKIRRFKRWQSRFH